MNNIWEHHVFNNETKYSMGHSERYLREDGPFSSALPIPVSREPIPLVTMVVGVQHDGFSMSGEWGFLSKLLQFYTKFPFRLQVNWNIFINIWYCLLHIYIPAFTICIKWVSFWYFVCGCAVMVYWMIIMLRVDHKILTIILSF